MGLLDEKVAVVTGGGRGIGRAEALALARSGASFVVNSVGSGSAERTVEEILASGGTAIAHRGDVSTWSVAEELVELAVAAFGGLDLLVNNAGRLLDKGIADLDEAAWDDIVRVNLKGHAAPTHFAVRYWRTRQPGADGNRGRIVNTASQAGVFGRAHRSNYAAAKGGVAALTLSLAQELAEDRITCNAILPRARTQQTAFHPETVADDGAPPGLDPWDPAHIGTVVTWLCGRSTSGLTGRLFLAYGGAVWLLDRQRPIRGLTMDRPLTVEDLEPFAEDVARAPVRLRPPWTATELLAKEFDD